MIKEPTVRKAVELAIQTEEVGVKFYKRLARKFANKPEVAEIWERLSEDEQGHVARFRQILEVTPEDLPPVSTEYHRTEYLRAITVSEIYKGDTFGDLEAKVETMEDALRLAVEFEKSTLTLYYGLKEVLGEHGPLEAVIAEERQHVVRLFGQLEKIVG